MRQVCNPDMTMPRVGVFRTVRGICRYEEFPLFRELNAVSKNCKRYVAIAIIEIADFPIERYREEISEDALCDFLGSPAVPVRLREPLRALFKESATATGERRKICETRPTARDLTA